MEFFRKTGAFLSTTLGKLADIVESLGGTLIDAFENPQQALRDFGDLIVQNLINRFEAVQKIGASVASLFKNLFEGEFAKALESLKDIGSNIVTSVTGIKNLGESVSSFFKEVGEAASSAFDLEDQLIANEKALADLAVSNAKSLTTQKELNVVIEDQTRALDERIKAGQTFAALEESQLKENLRLQEEKVRLLKATNELTNSTEEDIQRVRDAEIELANLQAASFERTVTNQNKVNALIKQQAVEEENRLKAIEKAEKDADKLREKLAKEEAKRVKDLKALKLKNEQDTLNGLVTIFGEASAIGKGFALTQIGFDTAQAISALTKASEGNPANAFTFGGAGVAQFIAGLARIAVNIGKAKQVLNSSGGAVGGGGGSSTGGGAQSSVQVVTGLANVNGSLLSQFGDGARTNAQNNEDIVNGVANLAPPQVAVTDINRVANRVRVKESEASL